ncbi:unnamed protein product [Brassica napus]|uniref:(rape) hypothetical protein n=1 Tax=Brassica napus TaxID=3708 RepID=A0A816KAI4_BRANA|nr:unnamed protein product [Brassica napus]
MIEKSVILPNNLTSFHVVAHSMGCIIAVALAAKLSGSVKSVALVAPAPPYRERIMKIVTWGRKLPTAITELTKHTHQSVWHSMHNVICGGAKFTDKHIGMLIIPHVKLQIPELTIHGDKDDVVPIDCLWNMKAKFLAVEVEVIARTDHSSVIMSRKEFFITKLVCLWAA